MILGLNKDLERAMKDKEKYRKKLKDHVVSSASLASLPSSAAIRANTASDREDVQSPALSEPAEDSANSEKRQTPDSENRNANAFRPVLERASSHLGASQANLLSPMYATPMQAPFGAAPAVRSPSFGPKVPSPRADGFPEHRLPTGTPPATMALNPIEDLPRFVSSPTVASPREADAPTLPQMQSLPQGFSSPKERQTTISRKAPPAPLNLSQQDHDDDDDPKVNRSGSDYSSETPETATPVERGRRPKRDNDDRIREEQAALEAESRLVTSDAAKESSTEAPSSPERNMSISSGYSSPEEPGSPHIAQVQTYQSLNALNAVLKTPQDATFSSNIKQHSLTAPSLLSPGLPLSPRPGDRPVNSPQPRPPKAPVNGLGIPMTPRTAGLPLSPRQPRQPIPLPPQTPMSLASPHLARAETYHQQAQAQAQSQSQSQYESIAERSLSTPTVSTSAASTLVEEPRPSNDIYRGFMTEQYPRLLLPPNALPSIYIKVDSSRLRPSRYSYMAPKQSEDNPVFTLAVYARSDHSQLWRLEKTLAALASFDHQLKIASTFRTKLPERSLFSGHAPAKIDARRSALGYYFETLLDTPLEEQAAITVCRFFSSDAIASESAEQYQSSRLSPISMDSASTLVPRPKRDGYLTKKGKNFGGWKARYFVCDGPLLKYFEAPGGAQLGAIKLTHAKIGKQTQQPQDDDSEDEDDQYRHAFLILEPKKRDATNYVKHVLCAESDDERDAWVECLLGWIGVPEEPSKPLKIPDSMNSPKSPRMQKSMNDMGRNGSISRDHPLLRQNSLRAVGYSETVAAEAPVMGPPDVKQSMYPVPSSPEPSAMDDSDGRSASHPNISGPSNGAVINNAGAWGSKQGPNVLTKDRDRGNDKDKDKSGKRSLFPFRGRSGSDITSQASSTDTVPHRPAFGAPLAEACDFAPPEDIPVHVPAVFYRCIEYLRANDASSEEGIFRLSGSNIVIKGLREKFNTEGDVKLLASEQYYDVHAVAGVLKLYLRELPSTVLTRDLHLDFLRALELPDPQKIETINVLVNRLPRPNRELLEQLTAFLREIVDNEHRNKMSVRNVGIVFAPTLNIPAPLITVFVTDHPIVFGPPLDISALRPPPPRSSSNTPLASPLGIMPTQVPQHDMRSPRRQVFPDQAAPAYNQSYFPNNNNPGTMQQVSRNAYDPGYMPMQQGYAPQYPPPNVFPRVQQSGSKSSMNGVPGSGSMNQFVGLNDVNISSSPLMGGESPEMSKDRGFDQPARQLRRQSGAFLVNSGVLERDRSKGFSNGDMGGRF